MEKLKKEIIKNTEDNSSIRLNKYMSDAGFCSRREADRLIESRKVKVNGKIAVLGTKVSKGQIVECDGKIISKEEKLILIAFNKPKGIECTTDLSNPNNIIDYIRYPSRIFPIGRLDKDSTGLILLTNFGEISDKILRGSNYHEKEYIVKTDKPLTKDFLKKMSEGVIISLNDGQRKETTRPCKITATGRCEFDIILTQGLNRQIRRMCEALGVKVISLKRIRVLNIQLGNLSEGHYRNITATEINKLIKNLKIQDRKFFGEKND